MTRKTFILDSVLDLNSNSIWTIDEHQLAALWKKTKEEEDFASSEEKLLNIIRYAFEVVHYNPDDPRDIKKYENGEWAQIIPCKAGKGRVAIRKKVIRSLLDLSYENVKHITAATLLELIDRNFGGGWESISASMRDIITSGFDISSTQLPANRIHLPGGTLERKVAQGYEVLEIAKGTWVEAIFAKKKEPVEQISRKEVAKDLDTEDLEENDELKNIDSVLEDGDMAANENDDTFYSSYASEAEIKDEDEDESFGIEEESEL